MPRSFEVLVESPTSVEQVHAAFGREDYWLARISAFGVTSTLDSLTVGADGTVRVAFTQDLLHDVLPAILAKFYRRDLKIRHRETWRSVGDGRIHGEIDVSVSGAPGCGSGAALVAPAQHGSRLTLTATVEFKVPLVGGTVENYLAREFAQSIPEVQRFTAAWITEHG